jgi:hypothetical protein
MKDSMYALTNDQIEEVSGAINWMEVGVGCAVISLGVAFTVASGGLGAMPLLVIAGAGTAGEIAVAATAVGLAALGGYAMGSGFTN